MVAGITVICTKLDLREKDGLDTREPDEIETKLHHCVSPEVLDVVFAETNAMLLLMDGARLFEVVLFQLRCMWKSHQFLKGACVWKREFECGRKNSQERNLRQEER